MNRGNYRLDLSYREEIHKEIKQAVEDLRTGQIGVIAASRSLHTYEHVVEQVWPELAAALRMFLVIDSETDALPNKPILYISHHSKSKKKHEKVQQAEARWRPWALEACDQIDRLMV